MATAEAPEGEEPAGIPTSEPTSEPLGTTPRWEPQMPYESGPPEALIRYEDLSEAERTVIDRLRQDEQREQQVLSVYAAAEAERFDEAMSLQAAYRLGLADLADVGVVGESSDVPGGLVSPGTPPPLTGGGGGGRNGGGGGMGTGGGNRNGTGGGS